MSFGFPLEAIVILFVTVAVSVWIDLYAHRNNAEVTFKDAAVWSTAWTLLAVGFYFYLGWRFNDEAASLFLAGYALERSLSIDNMMVFVAIFASFGIRGILQYRILYYGILGALVFRALFVGAGTTLFALGSWVELIFAAIVLWSAWALISGSENNEIRDYSGHWSVRLTERLLPVVPRLVGKRFFIGRLELAELQAADASLKVKRSATFYATPAILCLICIEVSDVVFSFDSVPAIIAVTKEPLLVYAAVIYAVVGLRSLYFMLVVAARYLCHLDKAVALVLVFVAVKLGASAVEGTFGIKTFHVHHGWSLWVVLGLLALGVLASVVFPMKTEREEGEDAPV
ncbi:MAG: TerC/Alx family metal homeostasis membrane protein [Gammaproteobacteria bacterium]